MMLNLCGMQIMFSEHCLEKTEVRLFPESKHRSARIHKKLVKRYGGEFRMKPAIFKIGNKFYAHPAMRAELQAAFEGGK